MRGTGKLAAAWLAWLGMVVVTVADVVLFFVIASVAPTSSILPFGIAFAALVAGLGAVTFFLLKWRAFAAGLVAGYVLLSLLSGGVCTFLREDATTEGGLLALSGAVLYISALMLAALVLGFISLIAAARR